MNKYRYKSFNVFPVELNVDSFILSTVQLTCSIWPFECAERDFHGLISQRFVFSQPL